MAVILNEHEKLVRLEDMPPLRGIDGKPTPTPNMYIKVIETEGLKPCERLVVTGNIAIRAPNGIVISTPIYKIVDVGEVGEITKEVLTTGESGLYDDISAVFEGKFKEYVDGLEAAGVKL